MAHFKKLIPLNPINKNPFENISELISSFDKPKTQETEVPSYNLVGGDKGNKENKMDLNDLLKKAYNNPNENENTNEWTAENWKRKIRLK